MTEIEQLKQELAAMQEKLNKLEKAEQSKDWPQINDIYWVPVFSDASPSDYEYTSDRVDECFKKHGMLFRTKHEAADILDAFAVLAELRRQPGRKLFVLNEWNYCIIISAKTNILSTEAWKTDHVGWQSIYFDSEQSTKAAIAAVGADRILKAEKILSSWGVQK